MEFISFMIVLTLLLFVIYFLTFFKLPNFLQENFRNTRKRINYYNNDNFKIKDSENIDNKQIINAFEANNYPCNPGYIITSPFWLL
jgi:hypothetical protein